MILIYISPTLEELFRRMTAGEVDVDVQTDNFYRGQSALHLTVNYEKVQLAEAVLERGADVNARDEVGRSALLYAVTRSNAPELVALLMRYGANFTVKDIKGDNALHRLVNGRIAPAAEVTRILIEMGVSLHEKNTFGYEPIHCVALTLRTDLIKLFLDHGAKVNGRANDGAFPLYLAADTSCDNSAMLKILLERGADVRLKTAEGRTALHAACKRPRMENLWELLSAGADVLVEDHDGNTPFALIGDRNNTDNPSIKLMIRVLALKRACLPPSIELKDERIIGECPKLWDYYRECHAHISRMKYTRFAKSCTFFDLLAKSRSQIVNLMRNPDFEANFGLYDLNGFSMYAEDVRRAFERAQVQHRFMLEREDAINEAVYHILPVVVVRRIVYYLCHFFEKTVVFSKC